MVESSAVSLARAGRFREAFDKIKGIQESPAYPYVRQLLQAELLQFLGHNPQAQDIAHRLLSSKRVTPVHMIRVHETLGLAAQDEGNTNEALTQFSHALRKCDEFQFNRDKARVLLRLLPRQAETNDRARREIAVQEATALVNASGDPHLHALLHLRIGQLCAKGGDAVTALEHFDRGRRVLNSEGNVYLAGLLALDTSVAHSVRGDYDSAIEWANTARENASLSGHARTAVASLANLAEYCVRRGDLQQALAWLSEGSEAAERFPAIRIAFVDSRARLLLQDSRPLDAVNLLQSLPDAEINRIRESNVWLYLSLLDTQADGLLALGKTEQALDALSIAIDASSSGLAGALAAGFAIKKVRVLIQIGEYAQASSEIVSALTRSPALETIHLTELRRLAHAVPCVNQSTDRQCSWWPIEVIRHLSAPRRGPAEVADILLAFCREMSGPTAQVLEVEAFADPTGLPIIIQLGGAGPSRYALAVERPRSVSQAFVVRSLWELANLDKRLNPRPPSTERLSTVSPESAAMRDAWRSVARLARTEATVLLTGETGVGKEFVARRIHELSHRATGPFVPFNCANAPQEMLDSQLFGHKKGAFTGASEAFSGVIRAADGGTLLLDEFGDIGAGLQPKFLRFLDAGEIHPLGEARPVRVSARVVLATNVDLQALVSARAFREDLFYRISTFTIQVPPLRERRDEVLELAQQFLNHFAGLAGREPPVLSDEAADLLLIYEWPGNVRQLQNEMQRLVLLCDEGHRIEAADLPPTMTLARRPGGATADEVGTLQQAVDKLERTLITRAMTEHRDRLDDAAEALGLSRKGLFLKRRRLGLL